ncbi:hypothetical protein HanIR_Chr06g0260851 [Helianthus annuus]|nr:hypothetical protein HanIR_Chr06g0260851 [Helianthus annuus]
MWPNSLTVNDSEPFRRNRLHLSRTVETSFSGSRFLISLARPIKNVGSLYTLLDKDFLEEFVVLDHFFEDGSPGGRFLYGSGSGRGRFLTNFPGF